MGVTVYDLSNTELTLEDYEKEFDSAWRIHNGQYWTHACNTKEQAIKRAKIWGGVAVGLAKYNYKLGMNEYIRVEKV